MNVKGQLDEDKEEVVETAFLSEAALAEDWLRPEEEEAWTYLIIPCMLRTAKPSTNFDHE